MSQTNGRQAVTEGPEASDAEFLAAMAEVASLLSLAQERAERLAKSLKGSHGRAAQVHDVLSCFHHARACIDRAREEEAPAGDN